MAIQRMKRAASRVRCEAALGPLRQSDWQPSLPANLLPLSLWPGLVELRRDFDKREREE